MGVVSVRAVVASPGSGLTIESRPMSAPAPGYVQILVAYGGICGSDLHYAFHGRNGAYEVVDPLVLGHEIVGVVIEVGEGVENAAPIGTRVAIHPAVPTPPPGGIEGKGYHLLPGSYLGSASTLPHTQGGFASRLNVLPEQLRVLPDSLPLRRAVLAEPLAVALHGVSRLGDRAKGARVLVSGAGPIGSLAILALHHAGAATVTAADIAEGPLERARLIGAKQTILLGRDALPTNGFDVVIEASGVAASLTSSVSATRPGGAILQLGILPAGPLTVELAGVVSKELTILGSQRFDVELEHAIRILDEDPLAEQIITHEFALTDAVDAFACAADPQRSSKVILRIEG